MLRVSNDAIKSKGREGGRQQVRGRSLSAGISQSGVQMKKTTPPRQDHFFTSI